MHKLQHPPKSLQLDLLDTDLMVESDSPQQMALGMSSRRPRLVAAPMVAVSALYEDPNNPRTEIAETQLDELAADIRQHGILQPIIVHPADADGRHRIHFGSLRWRAAQRAGLGQVPIVVRDAPADPYAQVAENQKRHGLKPMDIARFIRGRIDAGESNSDVARRLGMNLTTVAHHLSLLELPPEFKEAMKSGRCTSPRTLHELSKLHGDRPEQVKRLLDSGTDITRDTVAALRAVSCERPPHEPSKSQSSQLIAQASTACDRLERALGRIRSSEPFEVRLPELIALRIRVEDIARRWLQGSDRQTPSQF